ncbi:MAG: thiamine pyrophosphate-dependent enzyme [Pseudomonadota bacterium]
MSPGYTSCGGCASMTTLKQCLKAFGKDTVLTNNAGCLVATTGFYPLTAFKVPHLFFTYSHAGAAASGMEVALKRKSIDADIFLFGGDGGIFDIGLQSFSAALERGHNITYICYDNEAYMNTGVQRSGATPHLAYTKTTQVGKPERKKDIMKIVASHGDVYCATASPAYPHDLLRKLRKAKEMQKPAFIHIICPCPTGWDFDSSLGIELARLAVETGVVVLYEVNNGKMTLGMVPKKRKPVEEYLMKQGRFSHLTQAHIAEIQRETDERFYELTGGR